MAITKAGKWRKGEEFDDLAEYLRQYTVALGEPAQRVDRSACSRCAATTMTLVVDDDEGCAKRHCEACGAAAFLGDSEEYWEDADPGEAACPCGSERFEVGVAFSVGEDAEVRWLSVGARCAACGILGVYADWKIDYAPTDHLFGMV